MKNTKIFGMSFASVYPLYIKKAEKKGRTKEEVDDIIQWLTGYSSEELAQVVQQEVSFEQFFKNAPKMNEARRLITGVICGIRVEEIQDPIIQEVRYLDKLIDELAKGKKIEKIKRPLIKMEE